MKRKLTLTERMARIRKIDTKPELIVRRIAHAIGYRYRLHRRDLPGVPDLVFPTRRKVTSLCMAAFGIAMPVPMVASCRGQSRSTGRRSWSETRSET